MVAEPRSASPSSDDYARRIIAATKAFQGQNVAAVFLVHGTFAGDDTFGLLTELERHVPSFAKRLQRTRKRVFDFFARETGNFSREFARDLESALNASNLQLALGAGGGSEVNVTENSTPSPQRKLGVDPPFHDQTKIQVNRFTWSGLNHHIARADGAIRLIVELARHAEKYSAALDHPLPPRFQLWGHSHGGNAMALLANLLAADEPSLQKFFACCQRFYQSWFTQQINLKTWQRAQEILSDAKHPLRRWEVDYVTFGTPLRYDWPEQAKDRLINFVNHRPAATPLNEPGCDHLGPQRFRPWQLLTGAAGDYVQQIGIAGSNFPAFPPALRAMLADRSLGKLLEADLQREFLLTRIHHGRRVAECGTTLLVDYHDQGLAPWRHILGHGTYTRREWLPFHCEEVVKHLCGSI